MGTVSIAPASFPEASFLRRLTHGLSSVKFVPLVVTGSASYAASGDALGQAQLEAIDTLHHVWFLDGGWSNDGAKYAVWAADKLVVFKAFGTEEDATTDLSGLTWRVIAIGSG